MNHLLRLVLSLVILFAPAFASITWAQEATTSAEVPAGGAYTDGYQNGAKVAIRHSTYDTWFGGGLLFGMMGGMLGAGAMAGLSQIGKSKPPASEFETIAEKGEPFQLGFRDGYDQKKKRLALRGILIGGAIGTAVSLALYISSQTD
ncbi:hypothetical protein KKH27_11045 [bacterium]|nr:hypothetical protein [bacterium]MBU1985052.1 hypothetical protein [bacterium]